MDYYNTLRRHAGGHFPSASPSCQQSDRRSPHQSQSDTTSREPARAASPPISLRSSNSETHMPNWARDHSISLHPRHSRASSIVSTKTRTSINTIQEDTRSIDIVLGAQSFHINRDGSKIISNKDELPPYTPPAPNNTSPDSEDPSDQLQDTTPPGTPRGVNRDDQYGFTHISNDHRRPSARNGVLWEIPIEHRLKSPPIPADTDHFMQLTPTGHSSERRSLTEAETTPVRTKECRTWQSLPVKPGLGGNSLGRNRRSVSQGDMHQTTQLMDGTKDSIPWLRRRNSVQLPKIIANEPGAKLRRNHRLWDSPVLGHLIDPISPPVGPSFGKSSHQTPACSTFIERDNSGKVANTPDVRSFATAPRLNLSSSGTSGRHLAVPESPALVEEGLAENDAPPPMESDNDISIHYTRLIRSIDRDHRRALHQRDKELASMRERLNEVDQVYRKELKSRDFTIDDLKTRLQALEDNMQTRIEKAQNEVEDLWEKRWKDRDRHLMERMRRIELDSQKCVEQAVAERDEEWSAEWARKNEHLLERLKVAEEFARKNLPPS